MIFLTHLCYSRSLKILMNNSEQQTLQRDKIDELLMIHIQDQYKRWPDMTANALKEAIKIVKGQFRIEAYKKKICKSLVFELIMQEINE